MYCISAKLFKLKTNDVSNIFINTLLALKLVVHNIFYFLLFIYFCMY